MSQTDSRVPITKSGVKLTLPQLKQKQQTALEQLGPLLRPGQSVELLKALHILTRDGQINQDSRRKLKQIYHLYQFIETELQKFQPQHRAINLVDLGAGKSYLGFLIYELFYKERAEGQIFAIESRSELVTASKQLAHQMQFERMSFLDCTVQEGMTRSDLPDTIDAVTALHACDTATDDAIRFGIAKKAKVMVLVPCCQAYAARLMNQSKALQLGRTPLAELWRHPLHTREVGSQVTNVMRCLYLEACGYHVSVTELVGWEHSMKNELIIARFTGVPRASSKLRLVALADQFGLHDMLNLYGGV